MQAEIKDLFQRYESLTNAALADKVDIAAIVDLYSDAFIESSPVGVMAGRNDAEFGKALKAAFKHNREIGTREMHVRDLRMQPIDATHALASVDWRATYDVKGSEKTIDFTNVYLARVEDGKARVFGWITGDEEAVLRAHGII